MGAKVEIYIILSSGWIVVAAKAVRDMNQMAMSERKRNWEEVFILTLTRKINFHRLRSEGIDCTILIQ